jgi:hypothetical protein
MPQDRSARRAPARVPACTTLIEFLLDETGSMASHKAGTLSGFNVFLDEQKALGGDCLLTLTKFDSSGLKTPYTDLDIRFAPPLTDTTFVPGAWTNLRDALGTRVRALEERLESFETKPNVLVVVLTDGGDNQSHSYSEPQVRDLIRAHEADGWTFVYLGATGCGLDVAERLGFQPGNAREFDTSRIHETFSGLSAATTAFRTGQSAEFFAVA